MSSLFSCIVLKFTRTEQPWHDKYLNNPLKRFKTTVVVAIQVRIEKVVAFFPRNIDIQFFKCLKAYVSWMKKNSRPTKKTSLIKWNSDYFWNERYD